MKNIFAFLIIITLISSCNNKEAEKEGIIPPVKMAQIISDIYIAEYKSRHIGISRDSMKVVFEHYEKRTFEKHEINDSTYKKSFAFYIDHPKQLEEIYDMVIDSLSLEEQIANKKSQIKEDKVEVKEDKVQVKKEKKNK